MEGTKCKVGGHEEQSGSESEIEGRGRRTHGGEESAHKVNDTQEEEEEETVDETEKEQINNYETRRAGEAQ